MHPTLWQDKRLQRSVPKQAGVEAASWQVQLKDLRAKVSQFLYVSLGLVSVSKQWLPGCISASVIVGAKLVVSRTNAGHVAGRLTSGPSPAKSQSVVKRLLFSVVCQDRQFPVISQ